MKLGIQIPRFVGPGGALAIAARLEATARAAEAAGFSSLWVMDHFFQIEMVGPAEEPMLEGWTTLAYLARITREIRLGTMVTGAIYREPALLVKTATTVDVLSGGRVYFGIGAGWYEREAKGLGFPYPSLTIRFERLEETLRIARQMWIAPPGPFPGKHFRLEETLCEPKPIQRPYPPILIGGMGETKTLRFVARYGDACNLFLFAGLPTIAAKLETLRRHCDAEGRPYESIEKTVLGSIRSDDTPADTLSSLRDLAAVGISHAIFNFSDASPARLAAFGREVVAPAREI